MRDLHKWDLSYAEARELQTQLAPKVRFTALRKQPRLIAGLDCAFSSDGQRVLAAAVVLRIVGRVLNPRGTTSDSQTRGSRTHPASATPVSFELVETATASAMLTFPYIPGLLSFREAPACLAAVRKLTSEPDLFLIDGQGIAHPRRLGLAAHLGLFLDKPTVGCAKSRLVGTFEPPGIEKGEHTPLRDGDEIIGAVVRTRRNVKPLFISVGHKCRLEDAIRFTLACATKYRLPEPTRLAHQTVTGFKKSQP
ncbi:MAG: endonuclease V [Sedimentisphaerales bacterium]|nr:endonuclease V [Sedimentisphaerales bacterium]